MGTLGAIIGGGLSRRFGSDKALATIDGVALIDRVHAALHNQVDGVVICGRTWRNWINVPDMPEPGLGPLGGLNAALHFGRINGFDTVLSLPIDTYPLPDDLRDRLGSAPACFADQYLIGIWPTSLHKKLGGHINAGHRSMHSWIKAANCRLVDHRGFCWTNINTPADLGG